MASSIYYGRCRDKTLEMFDYRIRWKKIAKEYKNKYKGKEKNLFERADELYGNDKTLVNLKSKIINHKSKI